MMGIKQIDLITMSDYQNNIELLLKEHNETWNQKDLSFNPNQNLSTVLLDSKVIVEMAGRNLVFTHVRNQSGFIAVLSKTAKEEELKEDFIKGKPSDDEIVKQVKSIPTNGEQVLNEMSRSAAAAHINFKIAMGEYHTELSSREFKEYEIRLDPLSNFLNYGVHTSWVLPEQTSVEGVPCEYLLNPIQKNI